MAESNNCVSIQQLHPSWVAFEDNKADPLLRLRPFRPKQWRLVWVDHSWANCSQDLFIQKDNGGGKRREASTFKFKVQASTQTNS